MPKSKPLLLGHRGASKDAPENTVTAFELALSQGCDGVEFDVRRTSDGQLVICHDAALHGFVVDETPFKKLLELKRNTDISKWCLRGESNSHILANTGF